MKVFIKILILFSLFCEVSAAPYLYPKIIENVSTCKSDERVLSSIRASNISYPGCPVVEDNIRKNDLNGDGDCEYYVINPMGRRCESETSIMASDGSNMAKIFGDPKDFVYGETTNDYLKIVHKTWGGPRTNIIYTTKVYAFSGKEYLCEYCQDTSHGGFLDLAKKAYDKKNYPLAEIYYLNAYRMNGEIRLSDANNVAITFIKQKNYKEAIKLLDKHISRTFSSLKQSETMPCYSESWGVKCEINDSKMDRIKSSAYYNRGLAYKKLGDNKKADKDFSISTKILSSKHLYIRCAPKENELVIKNKINVPQKGTVPALMNRQILEKVIPIPKWMESINSSNVNTLGDINKLRDGFINNTHDDKYTTDYRIYYKSCYNAILNNYNNENLVVRCLSTMYPYIASPVQRIKLMKYFIENYGDYKDSTEKCGNCFSGETVSSVAEPLAFILSHRNGIQQGIGLLENILDLRGDEINPVRKTLIYATLGRLYLKTYVDDMRKGRIENGYIKLMKSPELNDARNKSTYINKRFEVFEEEYRKIMDSGCY